jgi:hypothetical protein
MIAPHDAAFLCDLLHCAQQICTSAQSGLEEQHRYYTTELQRRINRLPPDFVLKLEREG